MVIILLLRIHLALLHLLSVTMLCLLGAGNFNLMLILRLKTWEGNDPCKIILHYSRTVLEESHGLVQEFLKKQRNFTSPSKLYTHHHPPAHTHTHTQKEIEKIWDLWQFLSRGWSRNQMELKEAFLNQENQVYSST